VIDLEKSVFGTQLTKDDQSLALAQFVHRYTIKHVPEWALRARRHPDGLAYKPQFADDQDWLAHTRFQVRKDGRLDKRVHQCYSQPTWPEGQS